MGISPIQTNTMKVTAGNRYGTGIRKNTSAPSSKNTFVTTGAKHSSKAATKAQDTSAIRAKLSLPSDTVICSSIDGDLAIFSGVSMKMCNSMTQSADKSSNLEKDDHITRMLESRNFF